MINGNIFKKLFKNPVSHEYKNYLQSPGLGLSPTPPASWNTATLTSYARLSALSCKLKELDKKDTSTRLVETLREEEGFLTLFH